MNKQGFTLIEVLIALVIVTIALLAILKASTVVIEDNDHLAQKTIATWVACDAAASIQLGLQNLPATNVPMKMLQQTWYWSAETNPSSINGNKKIIISVRHTPQSPIILRMPAYVFATGNTE